jgi:hypothetical protein
MLIPLINRREKISYHSIFPDETLHQLFSNPSSFIVGKVLRDHYEQWWRESTNIGGV